MYRDSTVAAALLTTTPFLQVVDNVAYEGA